jgi:hypothetical protein
MVVETPPPVTAAAKEQMVLVIPLGGVDLGGRTAVSRHFTAGS